MGTAAAREGSASDESVEKDRGPRAVADAEIAALNAILRLEHDARNIGEIDELAFFIANETRRLVNARQIFVFEADGASAFKVKAISSLAGVERDAPLVQWMERVARSVSRADPRAERLVRDLRTIADPDGDDARSYPFPHAVWIPLRTRDGRIFAAMLLTRETAWDEAALAVASRLGGAYAHAWAALVRPALLAMRLTAKRRMVAYGAGILAVIGLVPLPLSALAPAEVVPIGPTVMAAPIDGVIASVEIEPNTSVKAGQVVLRFVDTSLRDNVQIADRAMAVASAKWKQYAQGAFVDPQAKRELSASEADYALKTAERDYAADLLARSTVIAPKDGIVVFNDKRDLVGRPVSTGQRLMEIADPRNVGLRINVAVEDSAVLQEGAAVRMFLDTDPLRPASAEIAHASHSARVIEGNQLVFRADAIFTDADLEPPRLGVRGMAQIYGARAPLAYLLLRRPISYLRQHLGL